MSVTKTKDEIVQDLFNVVQAKKAEIAKAEKPNWKTNCNFRYDEESSSGLNLHTVSTSDKLVHAYAHLLSKETNYKQAAEELGIDYDFTWLGFSVNDWKDDFKTRLVKINLVNEKRKLEDLEGRLNKLVSKEMREALELAEIQKMLEN